MAPYRARKGAISGDSPGCRHRTSNGAAPPLCRLATTSPRHYAAASHRTHHRTESPELAPDRSRKGAKSGDSPGCRHRTAPHRTAPHRTHRRTKSPELTPYRSRKGAIPGDSPGCRHRTRNGAAPRLRRLATTPPHPRRLTRAGAPPRTAPTDAPSRPKWPRTGRGKGQYRAIRPDAAAARATTPPRHRRPATRRPATAAPLTTPPPALTPRGCDGRCPHRRAPAGRAPGRCPTRSTGPAAGSGPPARRRTTRRPSRGSGSAAATAPR